jgi:hypothetical protein
MTNAQTLPPIVQKPMDERFAARFAAFVKWNWEFVEFSARCIHQQANYPLTGSSIARQLNGLQPWTVETAWPVMKHIAACWLSDPADMWYELSNPDFGQIWDLPDGKTIGAWTPRERHAERYVSLLKNRDRARVVRCFSWDLPTEFMPVQMARRFYECTTSMWYCKCHAPIAASTLIRAWKLWQAHRGKDSYVPPRSESMLIPLSALEAVKRGQYPYHLIDKKHLAVALDRVSERMEKEPGFFFGVVDDRPRLSHDFPPEVWFRTTESWTDVNDGSFVMYQFRHDYHLGWQRNPSPLTADSAHQTRRASFDDLLKKLCHAATPPAAQEFLDQYEP